MSKTRVSGAALDLLALNIQGFTDAFLVDELVNHPSPAVQMIARAEIARRAAVIAIVVIEEVEFFLYCDKCGVEVTPETLGNDEPNPVCVSCWENGL